MPAQACENLGTRERMFVLATCVLLVTMTSSYANMVTFFPLYATALGISPYAISLIFTAFSIGNLLCSLVAGRLASRYGRRPILRWGTLLVSMTSLFIGYTPELAGDDGTLMVVLFTAARFLLGGGVALARLAIFAVLGDAFPTSRGFVLGSATSMIALGYMLGPAVGGALFAAAGFRLPFLLLSLLVLASAMPVLSLWPKSRATDRQQLAAADSAAAESSATGSDRHSWRQLLSLVSGADVWALVAIMFAYVSKWAWWDIYVVQSCSSESLNSALRRHRCTSRLSLRSLLRAAHSAG